MLLFVGGLSHMWLLLHERLPGGWGCVGALPQHVRGPGFHPASQTTAKRKPTRSMNQATTTNPPPLKTLLESAMVTAVAVSGSLLLVEPGRESGAWHSGRAFSQVLKMYPTVRSCYIRGAPWDQCWEGHSDMSLHSVISHLVSSFVYHLVHS